jgi:hypothetical protein
MARWQALVIVTAFAGLAWAGASWDEAKTKAEEAKQKADDVRKVYVQATKKVVIAMCQARDVDSIKDAGQRGADEARGDVYDKLESFHRAVKEAIDLLDRIDSNDPHHNDASSLESELRSARDQLDRLTYHAVNGSPEFIEPTVRAAESARNDHEGRCSHRDFSADGERISCLIKDSDTCYVVATALDNSSSQSSARERARRGVDHVQAELKRSSPTREVNGCVHVEPRVDCLRVCPDVDSDGRVDSPRTSWQERCN